MKRLLLILFAIFLIASPVQGEFFKDVIVTSPTGIWTDSRAYTTLNTAVTAIGASEQDLYIAKEEVVTTLVIPANIRLHFLKDGAIANSNTLTINTRNIHADHQIFTGAGAVNFVSSTEVRTRWFEDFETAITQTSNDTVTLTVDTADTLANSAAVGDNVLLKWNASNLITIAAGQTLSNIGDISAPSVRLFAISGNITFRASSSIQEIDANWFGSSLTTLGLADTAAAAAGKSLTFSGPWVIDTDLTLSSHIKALSGTDLQIATTKTLTINGTLDAGLYQIFSCTGTGKVVFGSGSTVNVFSEWFGAVGDGVTDDYAPITSAITAAPSGSILSFMAKTYKTSPLTITKAITLKGTRGPAYGTTGGSGTVLSAIGDQTHVVKLSCAGTPGALVAPNGQLRGLQMRDIILHGGSHAISVGVLDLYGIAGAHFEHIECTMATGPLVRLQSVWDTDFKRCFFRNGGVDGGETIKFDSIVGVDINTQNNNIYFDNCHFETNSGCQFYFAAGSITDNFQLLDSKLESPQDSTADETWFNFLGTHAERITIKGCVFNRPQGTNSKYTGFIYGPPKGLICKDNFFYSLTGVATNLNVTLIGGWGVIIKDNINQWTTNLTLVNTNTNQGNVVFEPLLNILDGTGKAIALFPDKWGQFIPIHDVAASTASYEADPTEVTFNKYSTAFKGDTVSASLSVQFPLKRFAYYPQGFDVWVRARSTGGTGTLHMTLGSAPVTLAASAAYGTTYTWHCLGTVSAANLQDSAVYGGYCRVICDTVGETYYIDGIYIVPNSLSLQAVTYAATVDVDLSKGNWIYINTSTNAAITINNPTNMYGNKRVLFDIRNGTSDVVITWGAAYRAVAATTTVTANKRAIIEFVSDMTTLRQVGTPVETDN
jgi:hypothetical protein